MKIILTPDWLLRALDAAGEDYSTALNLTKLTSILSREDVAFYIYVNRHLHQLLPDGGEPIINTFEVCDSLSLFNDPCASEGLDRQVVSALEQLYVEASGDYDTHWKGIYTDLVWSEDYIDFETALVTYRPKLLTEDVISLIPDLVKDGPGNTIDDGRKELYNSLIGIVCSVSTFTKVAKSALFKGYIKACL